MKLIVNPQMVKQTIRMETMQDQWHQRLTAKKRLYVFSIFEIILINIILMLFDSQSYFASHYLIVVSCSLLYNNFNF